MYAIARVEPNSNGAKHQKIELQHEKKYEKIW